MTEETMNVALVLEALPPVTKQGLENAVEELKELIKTYCGGEISSFVINKDTPKAEF